MLTIHQRPFPPQDRSQPGHWEGDLIIGKAQGSAIGTLVERQTRMVRLLHLPQRDGDTLHDALKVRMANLPAALLRSITWDQGTEMARHLTIARSLGAPVYFCDSRSPWQRGSNENTNGLLRDYFPKGSDLSAHSAQHLLAGVPLAPPSSNSILTRCDTSIDQLEGPPHRPEPPAPEPARLARPAECRTCAH
jgi:IS30 family transposase